MWTVSTNPRKTVEYPAQSADDLGSGGIVNPAATPNNNLQQHAECSIN